MGKLIALALATALASTSASAATLYSNTTPTGALSTPGSVSANFNAGGGIGLATFQIQGYNTLDGVNCCTDTFSFILNGTTLFSGAYGLGGGGSDATFIIPPPGSSVTIANGNGGTITASIQLALLVGANTLTFDYAGSNQGLGDEGWGVNYVTVTGDEFSSAAPEPSSWALMIGGFGVVGAAMRRNRRVAVCFA